LFQLQPDGNYMRTLNQVPIDTPELQNVFERLTGTEKGAYVLKNGSPFVLVEPDGTYKLFADDTQYLGYGWRVNGRGLESIKAEMTGAFEGTMIGANRTALGLDARSVHLTQESVIYDGALHQRVTVANTTDHPINLSLAQVVSHDFPDMFEVRGWDRKVRGEDLPPRVNTATHSIRYSYKGRDGAIMSTDVHVSGVKPSTIAPDQLTWTLSLAPGEARNIEVVAKPGLNAEPIDWSQQPASDTLAMREKAIAQYQAWRNQQATIETDNPVLNKLIEQTYKDIYSLRISTPKGDAIAAGLPWFASLFGRDDLLTSLQVLPYMPDLCKDVLRTLAAYQGTKEVAETGEKPGKILHELRVGEMARAGEIPFAPSYHTVDATPLFLMLLGRYVQASGDTAFEREMRPTVDNIVKYLDSEVERGKGYLIYGGRGAEVLSNQGWKDSGDSILYSTGELAKPPIALSEVQGYLYDGWHQAAKLYERQGDIQKAAELRQKAAQLRERFRNDYWMPERNFIALALDGNGKQANVISSNPGHLLMTGILSESEARAVAAGLMERNMFSGWGDRTLESETARYFANSYHNGSVWPHDNSIIAMGMHHWAPQDSAKLMWSMFEAAQHLPTLRLPELFAGYPREQTGVPIPYPVACEPQAWSAVAIPSMLASSLGMHVDGLNGKLTFYNPYMPDQLSTVTFRNIRVGTNKVDVRVDRGPDGKVQLNVLDNPGNVPVYIEQPS
jgi:glycogen debranching enzyme